MKDRKRNRLKGYDYSQDNLYFVTICVKDRICCFGKIIEELDFGETSNDLSVCEGALQYRIQLNEYGIIVKERLLWLETQYPYVILDNFVVMPNNVHAVIEIDSLKISDKVVKIKSLSSLVGAFKTTSSKLIHETGFLDFSWQRSFHDHIIRTQSSYQNISNYIDLNPQKWQQDSLFSEV
ncbi:hypothetical protein ES674_08380 [Bizionia myxarmorum]|uniref:Transposase IS200-like domain-containing protein n=2 Tax=Bizionia myxarmorum TaxID=291186 RepID=A0A5D0RGB7_9FLAO|nr:hypothetical protein ES674_08380 [Bizionia myxarmorum]